MCIVTSCLTLINLPTHASRQTFFHRINISLLSNRVHAIQPRALVYIYEAHIPGHPQPSLTKVSLGPLHRRPRPRMWAEWKAMASSLSLFASALATSRLAAHPWAASPRWPILATRQAACTRTNTTLRTRRCWHRMRPASLSDKGRPLSRERKSALESVKALNFASNICQ